MSMVKPKGKFRFQASDAGDVTQYNLYGKQDDGTDLTQENLLMSIPAVNGQVDYEINIADIPGLVGANGENFVFAVASQDSSGNISDFSEKQTVPLDETPPDAPKNFTYSAE